MTSGLKEEVSKKTVSNPGTLVEGFMDGKEASGMLWEGEQGPGGVGTRTRGQVNED